MDERDKKRTMIPVPSGRDSRFGDVLVEGDDIPKKLDAAPDAIKKLNADAETGITPITLESMASYMKSLIDTGKNRNAYGPSSTLSMQKLQDDQGRPAPLSDLTNDHAFATPEQIAMLDQMGVIGAMFEKDEIKKLLDPNVGLHEVLSRIVGNNFASLQKAGGAEVHVATGHAESETPNDAGDILKKVSSVLKRNRFSPETAPGTNTPYASYPVSSDIDKKAIGKHQRYLGGYDNDPSYSKSIRFEDMKKIGLALMLRSTGALTKHGDPTDAATQLGAAVPGVAQLGAVRVLEPRTMWASDLDDVQGIPPDYVRSKLDSDLTIDDATYSYGNLNSYLAPFSGFAPTTMIALALALVIAVKLILEGFSLLFNASTTAQQDTSAIYPLGRSRSATSSGLIRLEDFGVHPVQHDYLTSLNRGIDVFFEFDGTSFTRVVKSPGYYAVLVRSLIRGSEKIVKSFSSGISNLAGGNPLGFIEVLSSLIDVFSSSPIIAFMNILASLGDTMLYLEDHGFLQSDSTGILMNPSIAIAGGKISRQDRLADNATTHIMKSRVSSDVTDLAWRTSSTPSLYLLPPSITQASTVITKGKTTTANILSLSDADARKDNGGFVGKGLGKDGVAAGRLNGELVKNIEDHLESEYVPFYFHDLRTNEIVSFHAFLSAITDAYSVNYDQGKYYGRVDPVMIYSDTSRTISLTFNIVSTNEKDFDVMWWKINKLTTLLYPQWSKGRLVKGEKNTFIQPFSQIPASSPIIRLRLGDIFKSNYSKFALARLFGLGSSEFKLDQEKAQTTVEERRKKDIDDLNKKYKEIKDRMQGSVNDNLDNGFNTGDKAKLKASPRTRPLKHVSGKTSNLIQYTHQSIKCDIINTEFVGNSDGYVAKRYTIKLDSTDPHLKHNEAGPYYVDQSELEVDDQYISSLARLSVPVSEVTVEEQAVEDFFSAQNNAIVRSFESVRGRGLAGAITAMSFDWKTPMWETKAGSRAPQYCTVTMSFQPIHDIAPGIDSDGFNRAPIYNVGNVVRDVGSDPYDDITKKEGILKDNAGQIEMKFLRDDVGLTDINNNVG